MPRLFVGIDIPSAIADQLLPLQYGVPGARWRPRENFHITLRFIGDVQNPLIPDIGDALEQITAPAFDIHLKGTGAFGNDRPRALWAGVDEEGALSHLARKAENALQRIGLAPEQRKYMPHVTLAYLRGTRSDDAQHYIATHSKFHSLPFHVDHFVLYESHLGNHTSHYAERETYTLAPPPWTDNMAEES